jgi:hypothetical protein
VFQPDRLNRACPIYDFVIVQGGQQNMQIKSYWWGEMIGYIRRELCSHGGEYEGHLHHLPDDGGTKQVLNIGERSLHHTAQ